jgi:circadian clock protein KaiB
MTEHARNGLVAAFERIVQAGHTERYVLRLYVAGMTARAMRAITNVREICDQHLAGRYDLEVVDVYQQPGLAKDEQIVAAPTLVKKSPLPLRRMIGDMSQRDRVLLGLDLDRSGTLGGDTAG